MKSSHKTFWYECDVRWESNRKGHICSAGKPQISISSPPEFKGEAGIWTPEDLFVAALNACTMTTFLAYAQHKNLPLVAYESDARGEVEYLDGKFRFTKITIKPHIEVQSEEAISQARQTLDDAHRNCMIANSTTAEVEIIPQIRASGASPVEGQ